MAAKKPPPFTPPQEWERYRRSPGLILGFHGCDKSVGESLLCGKISQLTASANEYDWLGTGIYFWEADPWRALAFAEHAATAKGSKVTKGKVKKPYVVGAVIDLGYCCNLLDWQALGEVAEAHQILQATFAAAGLPLPQNKGPNFGARFLDKAVMDMLHRTRARQDLVAYETVRAAFVEGEPLYDGAGFQRANHIQVAVRNVECIKGYFRLPGWD